MADGGFFMVLMNSACFHFYAKRIEADGTLLKRQAKQELHDAREANEARCKKSYARQTSSEIQVRDIKLTRPFISFHMNMSRARSSLARKAVKSVLFKQC
jgi:hypothetical protein